MKFDISFYNNQKIAVAVSGGTDSMALVRLAIEHKLDIVGLTVDHQLREEAKEEAKQVKEWLRRKGVKHHTLTWEGGKPASNIQALAREARYGLMTRWCKENGIEHLLVAHTMDDQVETFLLNLGRGSGIYGLAAMDYITEINGVKIVRPLLNTSKEELKEYLVGLNQEWIEDPSNKNEKYSRVKVRNILKELRKVNITKERVNLAVQNLSRTKDFIEGEVEKAFDECVVKSGVDKSSCDCPRVSTGSYPCHDSEVIVLNTKKFYSLHPEIGYRLLKKIIQLVGGNYYPPRFEKLQRLYKNMEGKTLGNCKFSVKKDIGIIITREK